ncbi:MAG TPA: peptide-methionine (S)-S-oxide reductase MsrA [Fimbriimonas sp.]|nr:peptide-methionine (S)-S-oxide reductase MsrA [Fimbriimonas sp.]
MKTLACGLVAGISACCLAAFISLHRPAKPKARVGAHPAGVAEGKKQAELKAGPGHQLAAFSAGCFWGVEETFRKTPGVVATAVGYMGGTLPFPTYEQSHKTGHAETVLVEFDPKRVTYRQLLDQFWTIRHPVSQGAARLGNRNPYRSAIWTFDESESKAAEDSFKAQQRKERKQILTCVHAVMPFYLAEDYHQQYDEKAGFESCDVP